MREKEWDVFQQHVAGNKIAHQRINTVSSDTARHACDYVCNIQWQSRTSLVAYPQGEKPQSFTISKPE